MLDKKIIPAESLFQFFAINYSLVFLSKSTQAVNHSTEGFCLTHKGDFWGIFSYSAYMPSILTRSIGLFTALAISRASDSWHCQVEFFDKKVY